MWLLLVPSIAALPGLLIWLLIIGIVLAVAYYVINNLFPEPIRKYAWVIIVVIAAILLIWLLVPLAGTP